MLGVLEWGAPPRELVLTEDELHVWQSSLTLDADTHSRLETALSPDEKDRAAKFRFASGKEHYIAARGILRDLLGRYLNRSPATIEFSYGPHGKPTLQQQRSGTPLHFNLSHSHGLAVFSFSRGREVGVDVESIRPTLKIDQIAERFFSAQEVAEFRALPNDLRAEGFFLCWTRKEAYIKARSAGLQIPLDSFSVSLTPGQPEKLESADSARWSLRSFQPTSGFVGAVVGEGQNWELRTWTWEPRK